MNSNKYDKTTFVGLNRLKTVSLIAGLALILAGSLHAQIPTGHTSSPPRGSTGFGGGIAVPKGGDKSKPFEGPKGAAEGQKGSNDPKGTGSTGGGTPDNGGTPSGTGGLGGGQEGGPGGTPTPGTATGTVTRRQLNREQIDDWVTWWRLNEAHYLQIEKRYLQRANRDELIPDLFSGVDESDSSVPSSTSRRRIRDEVIPVLRGYLKDGDTRTRAAAVRALGRIGQAAEIALLVPMTYDKQLEVRKAAIQALGLLETPKAFPYLRSILLSKSQHQNSERAFAALSLGLSGHRQATSVLIDFLNKGRRVREVDAAALYALGFVKNPRAQRFLEYYVAHPLNEDALRAVAVQGAAAQGDHSALKSLQKALGDRDVQVRRSAAIGIGQLSFVSAYRSEYNNVMNRFTEFNGDGFGSLRAEEEIETYLGRIRAKMETDERRLEKSRFETVQMLSQTVREDSDIMARNFALIALAEIGGDQAQATLREQFENASLASTRAFAALALAISKDRVSGKVLRKRLNSRKLNNQARAAVLLGLGLTGSQKYTSDMAYYFRERGASEVNEFAALGLGLLNYQEAVPLLRQRIKKKSHPELKRSYGMALGLLGDNRGIEAMGKSLVRRGSTTTKKNIAAALGAIPDDRSLNALMSALRGKGLKDESRRAVIDAISRVVERGTVPILSERFRHFNYLSTFKSLEEYGMP